jgi:DNA invertase Pin-like site-specific DNA recombinase
MKYAYARVSSHDQDLTVQLGKLRAAGCDVIRAEKATGTSRDARPELETLLQFLREGDELVVTKIDRLARSIADLQDILRTLKAKGVRLKALDQPIDTSSAAGKAFLDMLGVFAEFETNLRKERQAEGIARAKAAGVYKGRRPRIDGEAVRRLLAEGIGATAIARKLGVGRASIYRLANGAGASK